MNRTELEIMLLNLLLVKRTSALILSHLESTKTACSNTFLRVCSMDLHEETVLDEICVSKLKYKDIIHEEFSKCLFTPCMYSIYVSMYLFMYVSMYRMYVCMVYTAVV